MLTVGQLGIFLKQNLSFLFHSTQKNLIMMFSEINGIISLLEFHNQHQTSKKYAILLSF